MPASQQILHSLSIKKLKGIISLDEIQFDEKPLTAILGPNGCGKSTILHALACCYKAPEEYKILKTQFPEYFTPTTDATWSGSHLAITHTYRNDAIVHSRVETNYRKVIDRWTPRYPSRPERYVRFIGIKTCVPRIEEETKKSAIDYQTEPHADSELIRSKIATVFNRAYNELNIHKADNGRNYPGLALEGTRYSSLAMGAGEQRVLEILSAVFRAPKNALILIDEIDLLLHTAALKELIKIIHDRAEEKSLQIIFTTHREAILELNDRVSIKHIHTVKSRAIPAPAVAPIQPAPQGAPILLPAINPPFLRKTYCFSNTKPDALQRLTGHQERQLEIFVEDDVAQAIVQYELLSLGITRHASVTLYGAATNCFTLAAGLILSGDHDPDRQLYLLDGDLYATQAEQLARANAVLSGTEVHAQERRQRCLSGIKKFCAQQNALPAPEAQIHKMICDLPDQADELSNEIIRIARSINAVDDTHSLINKILEHLNIQRSVGLSYIIKTATQSDSWAAYVAELRDWLNTRHQELNEELGAIPAIGTA
ncbi:AAA family ATPase [Comamonas thiooxydans]|uniref:AAA family ATPase n=1 Tax=Comamonas thiooxydans TaxID=363952 RepID=UPI0009BE6DFB|nr:AAA family ATPase [Comamonas thiooxydans]